MELVALKKICIYFHSEVRNDIRMNNLPPWHRKAQKAYKVNRYIIVLQIVASLVMCGVILYGMVRLF